MSLFLSVLSDKCAGIKDADKLDALRKINRQYTNTRYGDYQVSRRYTISVSDSERTQMRKDREQIEKCVGDKSEENLVNMLQYPGNVASIFITLARSGNLHKANHLKFTYPEMYERYAQTISVESTDKILERFEDFQANKIKIALEQLEKEKRRMLNELNKSKAIYRQNDGGQSSLFSEEI